MTTFFLIAPPILFALTIHEFAHGWVADRLGDPTARYAGRLTFNPLKHLDPLGTLMIFLAHIGWAKPVPVNPYNLRDPKRDTIWISLAGPTANVAGALLSGLLLRIFGNMGPGLGEILVSMLVFSLFINLALAIFNLIPIPPLDGSKIVMGLLPPRQEWRYREFERYGFLVLMGIILAGHMFGVPLLWTFIGPFVRFFGQLFSGMDPTAIF